MHCLTNVQNIGSAPKMAYKQMLKIAINDSCIAVMIIWSISIRADSILNLLNRGSGVSHQMAFCLKFEQYERACCANSLSYTRSGHILFGTIVQTLKLKVVIDLIYTLSVSL